MHSVVMSIALGHQLSVRSHVLLLTVNKISVTVARFLYGNSAGADPGGFVGFGRSPLRHKEIFSSNSCREGAEFGEVKRLEELWICA